MKKLRILDYYVHQGNQYEFFKTGHNFSLVGPDSQKPNWDCNDRPLPSNVKLITEQEAFRSLYDVVIVRSPINMNRYTPFIRRKSIPVAVVQTTSPYPVPKEVEHIIWNCHEAMQKNASFYGKKKSHYIVHGFDPEEFVQLSGDKIPRVLTVANVFKQRGKIMGYDLWREVADQMKICDLIGHGNEKIPESLGKAKGMQDLINYYNRYQIFLNPTLESAMPRSRGEALMCGMATITTSGYDIKNYFSDGKNILFANSASEMMSAILKLQQNPNLVEDLGNRARETAIKKFNITEYVEKWNQVFKQLK